ncbi:zinc finger protein 184-like [Osmerus eperlanus]|uniref:zinc finger protein 184-like n=1 Tax=Osmerus eperlanus TaxID=29151 RepID=UPI002E13AF6B
MSKSDEFGEFIRDILTKGGLKIFGGFEKTFAEYKEEFSRSEEERKRLQRLLDVVSPPKIKRRRTEVKQLSLPEPPQIKEEQELWTSQEEEQLQGLQSETTDSIFTRDSNLHIRAFLSERLTTAASEIFGAIEITFAEYQEEISRSEEERKRIQRLLDVVAQPEIKLHRTEVQQLSLLEPPQIKEEQELWTSQEEEQLQGLKSETTDSILTSPSVKCDSDQDGSVECSHLDQAVQVDNREGDSLHTNTTEEQIKAETHVQDSPAPEPGSDSQPLSVVDQSFSILETLESKRTRENEAVSWDSLFQECSVAPDCPADGGVMLLQNRTQNNEALPRDNRPQGSHTGKTIHQCQQCNKRFADKGNLVSHIKRHKGGKPFQCQQCYKQFAQKGTLVDHMRTHTGEKPFQCQQCNKRFAHKSTLVSHMRTHTGEKPYQCQQCNKRFAHKISIVGHMKTHRRDTIL